MARPSSTANVAKSMERRQKSLKAVIYCWIDFLTNLTESVCIDRMVPNIVCEEETAVSIFSSNPHHREAFS